MAKMRTKLVGLGCKRRRGKDTAAEYIVENFPFVSDAFAFSLKEGICRGVFGLSDDQLYGDLKTEVDPFWRLTPREILQKAGTEGMRATFGADIWARTVIRRYLDRNSHTLVTDVRFRTEADVIKEHGGVLIRVDRDIPFDPEQDQHQSEIDLDDYTDWDYIIDNNGTLQQLHRHVDSIIREILHG
jgi:hypothetical protein